MTFATIVGDSSNNSMYTNACIIIQYTTCVVRIDASSILHSMDFYYVLKTF